MLKVDTVTAISIIDSLKAITGRSYRSFEKHTSFIEQKIQIKQ